MTTLPGFACGAVAADVDGPTHAYMASSPGCWALYGDVLTREYSDPVLLAASHRLTVDAYAVQHPGDLTEQRARRSVWLHLASLHAVRERGWSHGAATGLLKRLAERALPAPVVVPGRFELTVEHVARAGVDGHVMATEAWADASLRAWQRSDGGVVPFLERLIEAAQ